MRDHIKTKHAFTLIELLTVIAIIGVLVALLFPAIKSAILKAEISKAQTGVTGLATAFRSYYTEYGKWPAVETIAGSPTILVSTKMYGLLKGEDVSGPVGGGTDANLNGVNYNGNPKHIVFLEFKAADLVISGVTTNFTDPWKSPYQCRFDNDYDNLVADPFLPYGPPPVNTISAGFLAWSAGPGGQTPPVKSW